MRVSLVAICALVLLSVAAQAADQYYIVNTTDVYQTWGTSLRSLYPASISSGRMIVAQTDNDAAGNVYVVGSVVGTFQGRTTLGPNSRDGVIMKFNSAGNPLWIRYVASFSDEAIEACTVDAAGNLLVAGWTTGSLLGQSFLGGSQDAFVAKFSSLGDQLWLYQFGTPSTDLAYGISVDPANNPVVFGNTNGQMGTTNYGGWDVFVAKFNADNGTSIWVQQFGTTSTDYAGLVLGQSFENIGRVVGVSQYGNIYFAYNTDGTVTASGSTPKGYQDVYVVKLSPTGGALWTVQIASAAADWATSLVVDVNGDLYVGGRTQGPIMGQLYAAGWDCFISKVSSQGQVVWTRTFGNRNDQEVDGMTLDSDGNVYAVGYSSSSTFDDEYDMTLNPDYTYNRYTPGYVTKLDLFGNRIWTRFFRSTHGPRSVYYSVTSTFPFTVTALPSPTGGSSTGLVVGGPYTGLFLSDDDTSFGDVTSYYASFLFRVTQTVNCTLDQYNSVLTDINNLFYSLGVN